MYVYFFPAYDLRKHSFLSFYIIHFQVVNNSFVDCVNMLFLIR